MNIQIIAFGKAKKSEYFSVLQEFHKRIGKNINIIELDSIRGSNKDDILLKEEKLLNPYMKENSFKIILDSRGKNFSSKEFSNKFTKLYENNKKINFFIGSSFGFSKNITNQADLLLSLSSFTMPHMLARLVLLEQIYRAITITNNHPYHK